MLLKIPILIESWHPGFFTRRNVLGMYHHHAGSFVDVDEVTAAMGTILQACWLIYIAVHLAAWKGAHISNKYKV